jgi:hypothetical protein
VADEIAIPARFNGPPDTAHGGYASAVAAELFDCSAEVNLRQPPPLERPLSVHREDDGSATLRDGDSTVLEARAAHLEVDVPDPVSLADAEAAAAQCPWLDRHPFPTCFGCGPQRAVGDGMREFPGPVAGRPGLWATPWMPDFSLADSSGDVPPAFAFAALDCPSGAGAIEASGSSIASSVHVLARLTGRVMEPVRAGEPQVVIAWPLGVDGRKRHGGVAIFNGRRLVAVGRALWIALQDPARFGAATAG